MKETLPDTLDLIVVCVEAGMGVDAALNRVGKEQADQGLAMGEELLLATQELQAGAVRKEALTRCADRIGIEEFRGLITFLTQTEKSGRKYSWFPKSLCIDDARKKSPFG